MIAPIIEEDEAKLIDYCEFPEEVYLEENDEGLKQKLGEKQ